MNNFQAGIRYEFPFAQTSASVRRENNITSYIQSATGSVIVDKETQYFDVDNRTSVGKGGIVIAPFVDLNCNGRRDEGEPNAYGLKLNINGGRIERNSQDTTIRIFDLEPYSAYTMELDRNSFDNISWQIKKPIIRVEVNPNQFKLVQVPVAVVGEVSGTVYLNENNSKKGQGRITVCFYRTDSSFFASTFTESDGYFSFLGLAPGSYVARIDPAQLRRLDMTSRPKAVPFTIVQRMEGDVVDGLEIVLQSLGTDSTAKLAEINNQLITNTENPPIVEEEVAPSQKIDEEIVAPLPKMKAEKPCIVISNKNKNGYVLQIAPSATKSKASQIEKKIAKFPGLKVYVMTHRISSLGRRYSIFIGEFKTREAALAFCQIFNFK